MGLIFGYLTLLCFCLLAGKVVTRKLHMKKIDRIFRKIHKPVCVILLISVILHLFFLVPVIPMRNLGVLITGGIIVIFMVLILICCHTMKKKEAKFRWHRILSGAAMFFIICHVAVYGIDFKNYQNKIKDIQIQGIDGSGLPNGNYVGMYDAGYIYAKVEVTVERGKIKHIELLKHKNERGKSAEAVINEIIETQKTDVDAVAGATNSSKVIKRAVEDALQN